VGDPPDGAELVEPTLEDGYLLALDGDAVEVAA
jgi:ABC-2 type transport system ATP-binding protein